MKKIIIDPHNCSREEYQELKEYLDSKSWDYKEVEPEPEAEAPDYILREDGIHIVGSHKVVLGEKIRQEELHEFYIVDREELTEDLMRWIGENNKDKLLMKQDLEMLMKLDDDYIFSSNSTNDYIDKNDSRFDETCKELLELNESL